MPGAVDRHPFVSVVVPVRNGERTLAECLDALLALDFPRDRREILVVDNGSTDRSAEIASSRPVTRMVEPRVGVSNARNRGIVAARGPVIAFLDADCVPEPGWLASLVRPFADSSIACVAGELAHAQPRTAAQRQAVRMLGNWQRHAVSRDPPFAVTANAAFRRAALERAGGFDPRMTRAQDVELGLRLAAAPGHRLVHEPSAVARHRHRSTAIGFFGQQLGWAYGAGLAGAKYRLEVGSRPPRLREVRRAARGLTLVLAARARGRARPEHLEDARYGLMRELAWWLGGWAGLVRGLWVFRGERAAPRSVEPSPTGGAP